MISLDRQSTAVMGTSICFRIIAAPVSCRLPTTAFLTARTRAIEFAPFGHAHACKMGLEGIVSKRKDSPYRSGRSPHWIKSENPACAAVKREAEEDWRR
jgi:hypothetical protein